MLHKLQDVLLRTHNWNLVYACRQMALNRFVSIFGLEWGQECWLPVGK